MLKVASALRKTRVYFNVHWQSTTLFSSQKFVRAVKMASWAWLDLFVPRRKLLCGSGYETTCSNSHSDLSSMALMITDIIQWVEDNKAYFTPPVCNKLMCAFVVES